MMQRLAQEPLDSWIENILPIPVLNFKKNTSSGAKKGQMKQKEKRILSFRIFTIRAQASHIGSLTFSPSIIFCLIQNYVATFSI
jgi:hypothetical protein